MIRPTDPAGTATVRAAFARCRPHLIAAAAFSALSNVLALVPSIYMMQVYDRVVPGGNGMTLAMLSLVALFGLATMSALDWLRGRLLARAGAQIDRSLAEPVLRTTIAKPRLSTAERSEALRALDTLRQGVSSPAAAAIFDIPWAPIYILVACLLHPALGLLTLVAAIVLFGLAWHNERALRGSVKQVGEAAAAAYARQSQIAGHGGEVRALGMTGTLVRLQIAGRSSFNRLQIRSTFDGGNHSSLVKFLRLTLQSAALGLGALLVIEGQMSGGAVFAASLILGRALAPIEQVIGAWKSILQTRGAYDMLCALLPGEDAAPHTLLPAPTGAIALDHVTLATVTGDRVAIADMSLAIAAGEMIGLVGHSGAGKSTLLRAIAVADHPVRGHIRLDGASASDWDPERLAPHLGYLPQSFALFPGTVKQNIVRFREDAGDALDAAAVAAAQAIGAHEMILRLPQGYDTAIGNGGFGLSPGQAQRVAIARALFGDPRILLFDEPTAHLDAESRRAFAETLTQLRLAGRTVIFSTHDADLLARTDRLLVLREGRVERFGPIAAEPASRAPAPVSFSPLKVSR